MRDTSAHRRSVNGIFLASLILLISCFSAAQKQKTDFDYLEVKGQKVSSTHQARYQVKISKSFKPLGEFHHRPGYGEKQFNVSMAAFSDKEKIVLIHAEAHTDGSGGLDYSSLEPAELDGVKFTSREQCAAAEDETELNENPQIRFLREKGFDLKPPFYLKQYLTTDPQGFSEFIVSYGRPVAACDEKTITPEFKRQIEREAAENLKIKKIS